MDRYRSEEETLGRIPVFVFPSSVAFSVIDRDQLKQILTIYNPYEFPIRFKVYCNATDVYTVVDPEGSIKSKNCVDLIIRASSDLRFESNTPLEHKFRIQIFQYQDRKLLGKRDVPSVIYPGRVPGSSDHSNASTSDSFQQCPTSVGTGTQHSSKQHPIPGSGSNLGTGGFLPNTQQPNYIVIITAIVCVVSLMLPISSDCVREVTATSQSIASFVPSYLHLTINQKLLAAYALGLVTMVVFRP